MGYPFLILALVSLGGLGVLSKVADRQGCRPVSVNLFLFAWAAVLVLLVSLWQEGIGPTFAFPARVAGVAAIFGILASLAVLTFLHAVHFGKISTSWLLVNLSAVVPTVLSIVVYREQVTLKRGLSLMLALGALMLLWIDRRVEESRKRDGER